MITYIVTVGRRRYGRWEIRGHHVKIRAANAWYALLEAEGLPQVPINQRGQWQARVTAPDGMVEHFGYA